MRYLGILVCLASWGAVALEVNLLEVNLAAVPGVRYEFSFVVRNELEVPERFALYVGDWDRDEWGENRFYPPGTLPWSLASWVAVGPASFVLGPGEAREIRGTVSVPAGVSSGTYWGIVFIHGEPRPVEQGGTTVMVAKRIGIKVYATVGTPRPQGTVRKLEVRGLNPLWVALEFVNSGLANLREVRADVRVYDAAGRELVRVEPSAVPCLPGGARWIVAETGLRPTPGTYVVVARVDLGGEEVLGAQVTLRVRPLSLVPLVAGAGAPRDLDGDGLYEDVDGSGAFDEGDVRLFAEAWGTPGVQGNARAFDFDNSGRVDSADVEALRRLLAKKP
ncbi:MAG: hypothetical protein N2320_04690 [Candidatus Bipolaricaulota bacterium]|nr:hypothetical protein [Candidatus Bipolaricaulota bacterium]